MSPRSAGRSDGVGATAQSRGSGPTSFFSGSAHLDSDHDPNAALLLRVRPDDGMGGLPELACLGELGAGGEGHRKRLLALRSAALTAGGSPRGSRKHLTESGPRSDRTSAPLSVGEGKSKTNPQESS